MDRKTILKSLAMLAIGVLLVAGSPAPVEAGGGGSIAGSYRAQLDLNPLVDRIEAIAVYLSQSGEAILTSEHEGDKEAPGVGVWEHLGGRVIGIGVLSFRLGAGGPCEDFEPDNCVLKIGGTVSPADDSDSDGWNDSFAGEMFLTIESLDGTVVVELPFPLAFTMERMSLEDFPGALP